MVRENDGYVYHVDFAQGMMFTDRHKLVVRLESNFFDKDNQRFYTSLCVAIANFGLTYYDKHESKNNGQEVWRDIVYYYYGSSNDENKILKFVKKNPVRLLFLEGIEIQL